MVVLGHASALLLKLMNKNYKLIVKIIGTINKSNLPEHIYQYIFLFQQICALSILLLLVYRVYFSAFDITFVSDDTFFHICIHRELQEPI